MKDVATSRRVCHDYAEGWLMPQHAVVPPKPGAHRSAGYYDGLPACAPESLYNRSWGRAAGNFLRELFRQYQVINQPEHLCELWSVSSSKSATVDRPEARAIRAARRLPFMPY